MKKLVNMMVLACLVSSTVFAAEIGEAEVPASSIRVGMDGIGIVTFKTCSECERVIASITPDTKILEKGRRAGVQKLRANTIFGFVGIRYDKVSRKVISISY